MPRRNKKARRLKHKVLSFREICRKLGVSSRERIEMRRAFINDVKRNVRKGGE